MTIEYIEQSNTQLYNVTNEQQMKLQSVGVFMAGLSLTIIAELELLKYIDMRSRRILCGRPAGTYEVDMDEER